MSIEIWNPKELPFGPLSNNTIYVMEIDGQKYKTVGNYIYSNILKDPKYNNILRTISTDEVYNYFNKFANENIDNIISNSLYQALKVKFSDNVLKELLLSTENYPILYIDESNILGIRYNGSGKNLVGKYIMEIRSEITSKMGTKKDKMYEAYVALHILERLIKEENNDLSEYAGLNVQEIINKYVISKVPTANLKNLSRKQILKNFESILKVPGENILEILKTSFGEGYSNKDKNLNNLEILQLLEVAITKTYILFLYVKQKYLKNLRLIQLNNIKQKVFDIYVDNLISKNYPNLPKDRYTEAKKIEFDTLNYLEYDILKDKVYELFKSKLLPEIVINTINLTVNMDLVPENKIQSIEGMDVLQMIMTTKKDDNISIEFKAYSTYEETPYYVFSPLIYTNMLEINGLNYPTVMHYIVTNLFASLPNVQNINEAHKYLLINLEGSNSDNLNYDSYENLFYKFESEKFNQEVLQRKKLASIGINKKFEDIGLKELLIATGDNDIIWNDPYDDILGVGFSKGGENFVGKYLGDLRNNLKQQQDEIENLSTKDIGKLLENDIFMRSWSDMRLNDICKIINEIAQYIKRKYKKEIIIDNVFVINVLNHHNYKHHLYLLDQGILVILEFPVFLVPP